MDVLIKVLYTILSPLEGLLRPLSASNLIIFALLGVILAFAGLAIFTPVIMGYLGIGRSMEQRTIAERLARQWRIIFGSNDERPLRERIVRQFYRDGRTGAAIDTTTDFFRIFRISTGIAVFVIAGVMAIVLGLPYLILVGALGYNLPLIIASRRNAGRVRDLIDSIPSALRRIETRIAAGAEIREAFAKVAAKQRGPLFDELGWAAAQMAIPGNEPYSVMRRIDERNGIIFFAPLADQIERASKRGRRDAVDAFLAYIDKVLEEDETKRQAKISALGNKVMLGMIPFLIFALILSIGGPFVVGFFEPPL